MGTPILLGLDGGGIRTFGKYIAKENMKIYTHPIIIPYNISSKFQIGAIGMFVNKNFERINSQSGIGDASLFAKYQVYQKDGKGKTFRLITKLNQVFPTGKASSMPPIGSNAWQTQLGLVSGYVTLKYGLYAELAYTFTTNGLPDNFIYNIAFVYPLLPQKYPPKQVNLNIGFNGNYLSSINRNTIFMSSGVQLIVGKKILFETGIQLPLIENVPNTQKTKFIYTLGTRVLLF